MEVRENIDKIDEEIVKLIAMRADFVDLAVKFKKTKSDASAPKQVEEVIKKVRLLAEKKNFQGIQRNNNGIIKNITVVKSSPRSASYFLARELKGMKIVDAVSKVGFLIQNARKGSGVR